MNPAVRRECMDFVRECIETSGRSQRQVAQLLDVSPQTVNQWITGRTCPTLVHLHALCAVLDVPLKNLERRMDIADMGRFTC